MSIGPLLLLLPFVQKAYAEELVPNRTSSAQGSADELVDQSTDRLSDQALEVKTSSRIVPENIHEDQTQRAHQEMENILQPIKQNQMTLQLGVETTIKKYAPAIKKVVKVN